VELLIYFLDGFHNDDVFITVLRITYGLEDPELWKMDIVLGTGWDICFDANLKLSK
jgi:hypothetical protein